ncbi:Ig-like domain-containing protein [Rhodococcus sp. NPDC004095]
MVTPLGVGALAGVTILAGVPAQAAPNTVTFNNTCLATPSAVAGPQSQTQEASIVVDAPASVNAGEEYDVVVTAPPLTIPNSNSGSALQSVSRVKVDMEVPQNAQVIGSEIVPGTSSGLSGVAPNLLRVNENGVVDANGTILRLSGNNQVIGNSPTASKSSRGGIVALAQSGANTVFQLPQVKVRLKAGASGTVDVKLRSAGDAGLYGNDKNYLTFLPEATLLITAWAPTQCSPRDSSTAPLNSGAGPLASTSIVEADKQTTTTVVAPGAVKNGDSVTLTANVNPAANGGTVQFSVNGTAIGGPVDVVGGAASTTHTFDTDGDFTVTAVYSGAQGFEGSTSAPKTINVSTDDIATSVAMTAPDKAYVDQDVNLHAQVTPAVQGGTVEFTINGGDKVTGTVGTDGVAVAPYKFTGTGTHSVVARYSGAEGIAPSVAPAFPVSVTVAPPADVQTTTTLAAVGTVAKGQPVTLTATVDPANAKGKVQFKLGNTPLGAPVDVVNGVATLPTTFASAGTFSVTAEFVGAAGFIDSDSEPQTLTVPGDTDGGGGTGSLDGLFGGFGSSQ